MVAFLLDGKTLASARGKSAIKLWGTIAGQERTTLIGPTQVVISVAFLPGGKTLPSAGVDKIKKL